MSTCLGQNFFIYFIVVGILEFTIHFQTDTLVMAVLLW